MNARDRYAERGVSADKEDVHKAIENLDKGLYPKAFCKILPDFAGRDENFVSLLHADTAGTKSVLAYLYYKETQDLSVWPGIVQDALVMNLDDMACAGCCEGFLVSSTIGRNAALVDGKVLEALIHAPVAFADSMRGYGIDIELAGGETADVGDLVRTIDVGFTAFSRIPRNQVRTVAPKPGDRIIGLASFGQTRYEREYNSGIGCNGLTAARHELLNKEYGIRYPETFAEQTPDELIYSGTGDLQAPLEGTPLTLGKALLSPTRTYLPFFKALTQHPELYCSGIVHCTGGGLTKVMKFVNGLRIIKDQVFNPPPIFRLIAETSPMSPESLYKVFNMGQRLEVYTDEKSGEKIMEIASNLGISSQVIGYVEASDYKKNELIIESPWGTCYY